MLIFRVIKWVFRLLRGRALGGVSGSTLSGIAGSLLGGSGAELPALIKKLTTGGLGDVVQSWVSKGKNQPVSADQVKSALGSSALSGIASQLGTSEDTAASKVAGILPKLIDQLTPDGVVPDQKALAEGLAKILKR